MREIMGDAMKRVITFGEIMLRLSPKGHLRFFQENELEAVFGGFAQYVSGGS